MVVMMGWERQSREEYKKSGDGAVEDKRLDARQPELFVGATLARLPRKARPERQKQGVPADRGPIGKGPTRGRQWADCMFIVEMITACRDETCRTMHLIGMPPVELLGNSTMRCPFRVPTTPRVHGVEVVLRATAPSPRSSAPVQVPADVCISAVNNCTLIC